MKEKITKPIYFVPKNGELNFEVIGKPFGKQRPRVTTRGRFARAYTPKKTADYEKLVRESFYNSLDNKYYKLDGPIEAFIDGVFEVPKSTSNKKREEILSNTTYYTKKPDSDNIAKSILDALNELAYDDDSQVSILHTTKVYGETAKVKVRLKQIKEKEQ